MPMGFTRRCSTSGLSVFFEQGASAFAPKQSVQEKQQAKKIAVLQAKLTTKNEVLSELMEEHIFLKKSLGET